MQLPFLKKDDKAPAREYFFALEIDHLLVKAAVWSVVNDKPQVLAVSSTQSWDDKSEDSLITAADSALTDATHHLDPSGKTTIVKVIFGLPPDWVGDEKIHTGYLHLLKSLSEKLELKAIGYVITPEAAIKYLQATEGVPPTAILIGFWPSVIEVTLVRLGKIASTQLVKKSSRLTDDVVEGLSRFSQTDMLPSRMLLYDSGLDLEEIKQLLLDHPWQSPQKHLPFLHFPKVEILPADFSIRSIALSGGSEVAQSIGLISEPAAPPISTDTASDLGFVTDTDIRQTPVTPEPEPAPTPPPPPPAPTKPKFVMPKIVLPKITIPKFTFSLPKSSALLIIVVGFIAVLGLALAAYWLLPKATVILFVTPKKLQQQFDIVAGGDSLPAEKLEVSVSDVKTVDATGSKVVGDKASGSVTITNNVGTPRALSAGTVITSPSGLKFVLDESVNIASASGDVYNPQPGKATAKITASQIGADSNLSAGTVFRVGTYSSLETAAKNDAAFSGGTSRQAKAVSKDDITKLKTSLSETLKSKAREELMEQLSDDQTIITESITLQVVSEEFNHKEGDEADSLTFKLSIKAQGLAVSKSELDKIVADQIGPEIPSGFSLDTSEFSQNFSVKKTDKTTVTFQANVTAVLLPDINTAEVAKNISGKYPDRAKDYLASLPSVGQIDILITPKFPTFLATLPRLPKNITISVQPLK